MSFDRAAASDDPDDGDRPDPETRGKADGGDGLTPVHGGIGLEQRMTGRSSSGADRSTPSETPPAASAAEDWRRLKPLGESEYPVPKETSHESSRVDTALRDAVITVSTNPRQEGFEPLPESADQTLKKELSALIGDTGRSVETMGEAGAIEEMRQRYPEAQLVYIGHGKETFDLVYQHAEGAIVVECKGGTSTPTERQLEPGYVASIADKMKNAVGPEQDKRSEVGEFVSAALKEDRVAYVLVGTRYDRMSNSEFGAAHQAYPNATAEGVSLDEMTTRDRYVDLKTTFSTLPSPVDER